MISFTVSLYSLICIYVAYSIASWYRLSHVPGPFWATLTKFWLIREAFLGRQPTTLKDVTNQYGDYWGKSSP